MINQPPIYWVLKNVVVVQTIVCDLKPVEKPFHFANGCSADCEFRIFIVISARHSSLDSSRSVIGRKIIRFEVALEVSFEVPLKVACQATQKLMIILLIRVQIAYRSLDQFVCLTIIEINLSFPRSPFRI